MFKLSSKNFPLKEEAEDFKMSNQLSLSLKTKSGSKILSSISLKNESRKLKGLSVPVETVLQFRRSFVEGPFLHLRFGWLTFLFILHITFILHIAIVPISFEFFYQFSIIRIKFKFICSISLPLGRLYIIKTVMVRELILVELGFMII